MNGENKNRNQVFKYLSLLTQFGLSIATPPIICIFAALFIQKKFSTGDWIVIVSLVVGLISSGCSFYDFIKKFSKKAKSGDKDDKNRSDS